MIEQESRTCEQSSSFESHSKQNVKEIEPITYQLERPCYKSANDRDARGRSTSKNSRDFINEGYQRLRLGTTSFCSAEQAKMYVSGLEISERAKRSSTGWVLGGLSIVQAFGFERVIVQSKAL